MHKKKIITTLATVLVLTYIGYFLNKHIVTVTDYENNATQKSIFVLDLSTVKKIPNYKKDEGYELVYQRDYDKYHQGYCLKENRILSDEEIFRRGIINDLKKRLLLAEKICFYDDYCREPVKYYLLGDINSTNWYEKFTAHHNGTKKIGLIEMLFKTSKMVTVNDIAKYMIIDMKNMIAKLNVAIISSDGEGTYGFMTDKFYLLHKTNNSRSISIFTFVLFKNRKIAINDILEYKEKLKKGDNRNNLTEGHKIDNCGNINLDIEKTSRLLTQGG